mmetsp:Transcript_22803/g.47397  ORF Transcript_22803/g.47397 Transcript_22803/m.47397 type:complete len:1288 (-) Transcript_22803:210-4073(-)
MTPATYSHGTFTTTASTLSAGTFSPPSPSSARTSSAVNGTSFSVGRRTRAAITPCPDRSPSAPDRSSATGDDCLSYRDRQTEENRVPRFFFHEHDDDGDENDNDESHHSHNHNHNRNGSQRNPRHHNSHTGCDRSDTSGTSHHSHGDTPKIERLREKKRDLERRATAIRLSSPRYSRLGREDDEEFETCPVTARREVGTRHDEVWTPGRRRRRRGSADGAEGGDVRRGRSRSQSASARNRLREIHRFGLANGLGHGHEHEQGHGSGRSGDSPVSITTSNGNSSPALAKLRELKRNLEGRRPQRHPLHIFTEGVDRERKTHDNRLTPSSPRQAVPVIPTLPSTPATPKIVVDPLEKEDELLDSDLQTQQQQHQYTQPQSQPRPQSQPQPKPLPHFHPQSPETILHSHPISQHCSSERHRILERRRQILLRLSHSSPSGSVASHASVSASGVGSDTNSLGKRDNREYAEEQVPIRLFHELSQSSRPTRHGDNATQTNTTPHSAKKSSSRFQFSEFHLSKHHHHHDDDDNDGKEKCDGDETSTTAQSHGTHDVAAVGGGMGSGIDSGGVGSTTRSRRGCLDNDGEMGEEGATERRAEAAVAIDGAANDDITGMAGVGVRVEGGGGGGDTVSSLGSASYLHGQHPSSNHSVMSSADIALQLESLKRQLEQHGETLNKLALGKSDLEPKDGEENTGDDGIVAEDGDADNSVTGGAHSDEFGDDTSPLSTSPVQEADREDRDDLDNDRPAMTANDEQSPYQPYEDECDNDNEETTATPYHDPLDDPITEVESLQLELFERNIQITQLLEKVAQLQSEISESTDQDVVDSENPANSAGGSNGGTKKFKKKKVFSANFAFGEAKRAVKGSIHEVQDLETEFKTQMESFADDFEKVLANLYDPEEDEEENEVNGVISSHLHGTHHELETVDEDDCSMVEGLYDGLPVDLAQQEFNRVREERVARGEVFPEAISAETPLHEEVKEATEPGPQQVGQDDLVTLPPLIDIEHEPEEPKSAQTSQEDIIRLAPHADIQRENTEPNSPEGDQEDLSRPTAPAGNKLEIESETLESPQTDQEDDAVPRPPCRISNDSIEKTALEAPETASDARNPVHFHNANHSPFSSEMINRQYPYPQHPPQSISNTHTALYHSQNPPHSNPYPNSHTIATTIPSTSISNPLLSNSSSLQSLDSSTISAIRSIEKTLSKQKKKEKKGIHQLENELKSVREEIAQLASVLQRTTEAAAASAANSVGAHSQSQSRLGNGYSHGASGGKKGKGRFKSLIHALSVRKRLASPSKE